MPQLPVAWEPLGAALAARNASALAALAGAAALGAAPADARLRAAAHESLRAAAGAYWLDAALLLPAASTGAPDGGARDGRAGHGLAMRAWVDEAAAEAAWRAGAGAGDGARLGLGLGPRGDARGGPRALLPPRAARACDALVLEVGPRGCDGVRPSADAPCAPTPFGPLNVSARLWDGARAGEWGGGRREAALRVPQSGSPLSFVA
jgi:hypothetical protein